MRNAGCECVLLCPKLTRFLNFIETAIKGDIPPPFQALQILENTGLEDTIGAIWVPVRLCMYTHVSMLKHVRTWHVLTYSNMFEHDIHGYTCPIAPVPI